MHIFSNRIDPQLKRSGWLFLLMLAVSGCATHQQVSTPAPEPIAPANDPISVIVKDISYETTIGAHRGDSVIYLENTLDAIRSARENPKFKFIEFDVQYSADKQAIVFHDSSLRRLFDHPVKVRDLTYAELCDLSSNQIPTYEAVMAVAEGKPLNIEIKSQGNPADDELLIDYIMDDLMERGIEDRILMSSISAEAIKYVKEHYPEMPTGQIFWKKASTFLPFNFLTVGLYEEIDESRADYLMLHVDNRRNLNDLLRFKPKEKMIVFWDFDDTMYLVHKDPTDQLWSEPRESLLDQNVLQQNAQL